ncbi:MAG TPA: helix-turn-helix transcriptional regulator, partial [Candidatus Baltobacteraceae bacterium]|nr:helix-turn-helix transcriptional regulator [Candidatus Baltobacteraceae bacterium]
AEIDVTLAQTLLLRFEQAQAHISHAMAMCRDPYLTALAGVAKAAISAARNDVNGVRRAAKAAFDVYDGLGMQWRAGWCAVMLYRAGCGNEWLRVAKNCVESYPRSFIAEEIGRLEHRQCQSHNPDLTARQREIFALLMDGRTIDEIADLLSCSRNTVRIHVGAVYRKLGVRNRVELLTQVAT